MIRSFLRIASSARGLATKAEVDEMMKRLNLNSREFFGLDKRANRATARKAWMQHMMKFHPDCNAHLGEEEQDRLNEIGKKINSAYEVIMSGREEFESRPRKKEDEYELDEISQYTKCALENDPSFLELSFVYAFESSKDKLAQLSFALAVNLTLQKLSITWVFDDHKDKAMIFRALADNKNLRELEMTGSDTHLQEEEVKALSEMISKNKTLQKLDFIPLAISSEYADMFCQALRQNKSLLSVRFGVGLNEKVAKTIAEVTARNNSPDASPARAEVVSDSLKLG